MMTHDCTSGVLPLGPSLTDVCTGSTFFLFMSLLDTLIRVRDEISGRCERVKPVETLDDEYDFIVVGGGAAGSAVAGRLSEIPDWKVLLLEAGDDEPAGAEVPGFANDFMSTSQLSQETGITWNYTTTNESNACLSSNGSCSWPSGKNLGGNTVHNGMMYSRGHPLDYDHWAELGNEGWSWDEVKRYFLKAENNGEIERVGRVHHATDGPLSVERFPHVPPLGYSILEASGQAGYGVSDDLDGDKRTGFSIIQAMQKKGIRCSSAGAYLRPVRNRGNLHVSLNSTVTKVIIVNDTAVGVQYYKDGELQSVHATREVILSGGTVESPHLLLLSGIGPMKDLESVGVEVIKDLPGVGENLHNHPSVVIPVTINETDAYDNDWIAAEQYLVNQTGPLSGNGIIQVVGMLASNYTTHNRPDIELYISGYSSNCATGKVGGLRSTGRRTVQLWPVYLYPKSRGRITLASNNSFEHPLIWLNNLGESEDVERLVEGVKMALALLDTEAFRGHDCTLSDEPLKACSNHEFKSDEYWACFARHSTDIIHHQGGTCKMGPSSDPMAVVDPRLRVHGINRLRVVDNSIMPMVPASNTAAPAMMIGERGADFIKKDWGSKFD